MKQIEKLIKRSILLYAILNMFSCTDEGQSYRIEQKINKIEQKIDRNYDVQREYQELKQDSSSKIILKDE